MFSDLIFRMSKESDLDGIRLLLSKKFGVRDMYGVFDKLEGRYYIAVNSSGVIVAMTGLNYSYAYNGPEIDWTCVDDAYTGKGLMTKMISNVIANCKDTIYCSCWREFGKDINLKHAMAANGFKPIQVPRITYDTRHNSCKEICTHYNANDNGFCTCCEDLYIRHLK